ncbi:MAG TPA: hypothetical protein VFR10_05320 [bacterium]|nr:hypothetical protein [bacterium]
MAEVVRRIGLSLGADICWPICYEEILKKLDLAIPVGKDTVRFEAERVTIEPFSLRQPVRYDLVIDRLTHWYHTSREWIKKAVLVDDLYVFNNPWAVQAMEKHTSYCAMIRLGMPIPDTWMVPPKDYEQKPDLRPTLERYARLFDLGSIGEKLTFPLYMKPYDGGGWIGVSRIENEAMLRAAYEQSGRSVMHLQKSVEPFDLFVRCIGLGPQTRIIRYDPAAPLHDRYTMDADFLPSEEDSLIRDITLTINSFFGWDFNSCETLRSGGEWIPIDFANPCPDSQVTSLHRHFPWIVLANLRWSIFCAATRRPMRKTLDWDPFYAIAARDLPYREKIAQYAKIARERFDTDRFEEFCARHLAHLDQVAWDFFGTGAAMEAVRKKVEALFPASEVEPFTQLFWVRIQEWRESAKPAPAPNKPMEPNVAGGKKSAAKAKSTAKGKAKSKKVVA